MNSVVIYGRVRSGSRCKVVTIPRNNEDIVIGDYVKVVKLLEEKNENI